jgi:hypothetical protein
LTRLYFYKLRIQSNLLFNFASFVYLVLQVPIKDHVGIVSISIPSSAIQAVEDLGYQVADMLVASGAADILQAAKAQTQAKVAQHRPHTNNVNNNH